VIFYSTFDFFVTFTFLHQFLFVLFFSQLPAPIFQGARGSAVVAGCLGQPGGPAGKLGLLAGGTAGAGAPKGHGTEAQADRARAEDTGKGAGRAGEGCRSTGGVVGGGREGGQGGQGGGLVTKERGEGPRPAAGRPRPGGGGGAARGAPRGQRQNTPSWEGERTGGAGAGAGGGPGAARAGAGARAAAGRRRRSKKGCRQTGVSERAEGDGTSETARERMGRHGTGGGGGGGGGKTGGGGARGLGGGGGGREGGTARGAGGDRRNFPSLIALYFFFPI